MIKVSQGSVATKLSCGGKSDKCFIANFLLNPTVKNLKIGKHLAKDIIEK